MFCFLIQIATLGLGFLLGWICCILYGVYFLRRKLNRAVGSSPFRWSK